MNGCLPYRLPEINNNFGKIRHLMLIKHKHKIPCARYKIIDHRIFYRVNVIFLRINLHISYLMMDTC
jgi:hypothetical protein